MNYVITKLGAVYALCEGPEDIPVAIPLAVIPEELREEGVEISVHAREAGMTRDEFYGAMEAV